MEVGECLNELLSNSNYKESWSPLFGPYSFVNISSGKEEMDDLQHTWKNMLEVAVVIRTLHNLYKARNGSNQLLSVTIASAHAAQLVEIKEKLGPKYDRGDGFTVKVVGIDELQGGKEEDILVLSMVTSNSDDNSIDLLSDLHRVNLVFASARNCLWILGNERTLLRRESVWKSIIGDAKKRRCFFNVEEDKDLAEFLIDVKQELDELDELCDADSFLFKNARWKVLFSDNFKKSFEKVKSKQTRKLVVNMLLRLANGWRPKKRNINITCEKSRQNLKQFKVKGMYIICSIDIMQEYRFTQVLKVWDLLPLMKILELVNRLDTSVFLTYSDDFINHCKAKHVDGDLEIPMSWEASCKIDRYKISRPGRGKLTSNNTTSNMEVPQVSQSLFQMKFYALSSYMVDHLLSSCDGTELELPFELTIQEMEIINFDKSSFVLGRSGTGKSTVIVRKLVQREQLHHIALEGFHEFNVCPLKENRIEDDEHFLRQIFVTLNPRLCYAVKQQVSSLKRYAYGGNSIEGSSFVPLDYINFIPDSFLDLSRKEYPLVITFQKFLMMLDGTIGNSFFNRFPEARGQYFRNEGSRKSMALESFIRVKEVNFDKFNLSYWPHFNVELTNGFEPSQVFIEIMSHLKGGLKSGDLSDGNLSQKDYILKSNSRVSNFSRDERSKIYDIFLQYEKLKMFNGEYDLADLVCDLHHRFKDEKYEGDKLDFVYIDEVQDLTMGQIALFKYICKNVDDGYVFSGDTAQTIAKGSDFRFEDIRCLFYREFVHGKGQKGLITNVFQLSQNFRSHSGVLNLAQSVTNLIYHFFPLSIDVLNPETSLINGQPPLLVEVHGENEFGSMFCNGGDGGNFVGFGAEQAILVRDDNIKNELLKYVGKHALVLTISECKGLEFQDVLLYNFLSSSPIKNQWRVIYEFMKEHNIIFHEVATSFPSVNEAKHRLLCSELKQLYVAVTRTRQRLWIFENELSHPMCDYWKKQNIVKVRELDNCLINEIQVASSVEEWSSRGMKFFYAQNYGSARMCFGRAGEEFWEKRAEAAELRVVALSMSASNTKLFFYAQNYGSARMCFGRAGEEFWEKRAEAAELRVVALSMSASNTKLVDAYLRRAAEIFDSISIYEQAAQCYYDAKEYIKAGEIYLEKCLKYKEAGESFCRAGCYERAASAFAKNNSFNDCLEACTQGKILETGLSYIISWKQDANICKKGYNDAIKSTSQKFLECAARSYIKLKDHTSMMKFVNAFHSKDMIRCFLRNEDFLEELFQLEIDWGCSLNAANIAKQLGKTLFGAKQLEKANHFEEASSLLLFHVLVHSLWGVQSSGWPLKHFPEKEKLLAEAKLLAQKVSANFFELVCTEEKILSDRQVSYSMLKKLFKDSQKHSSIRGQILCARKILDVHCTSHCSTYIWQENYVIFPTENEEKILSSNQVSAGSLFYFWNVWKQNIEGLLGYLKIRPESHNTYWNFCLDYFGMAESEKTVFHLVIPDAYAYLKKQNFIKDSNKSEKIGSLNAVQFADAAGCYWRSQMVDVGNMVLKALELVFWNLKQKSFYPLFQMMPLFYMFKVAKFLLKYECNMFRGYLEFSRQNLTRAICSMDWKRLSTLNMTQLRETEDVENLLEDVIFEGIRNNSELTYKQIGNFVMMVTSHYGKLCIDTYKQISLSFVNYPFWKSWIDSFDNIGSEFSQVSSVQKLFKALEQTYYADSFGKSHYVSPNCFMYMIERLLIMIFQFKGCFLSIKSSVVEWLLNQEWNINASHYIEDDWQQNFGDILDIVAAIVAELLCNKDDVMAWIKDSDLSSACHRELVLRLFVALCLLCVNCGKYYELLFDLLGMSDITSLLPQQLYYVIRKLKPGKFDENVCVLAQSFQRIANPLVILSSGDRHFNKSKIPTCSIFVDMEVHKGREELISLLFKR